MLHDRGTGVFVGGCNDEHCDDCIACAVRRPTYHARPIFRVLSARERGKHRALTAVDHRVPDGAINSDLPPMMHDDLSGQVNRTYVCDTRYQVLYR